MFVTSNVYLNIMFLHIACGFEILHKPFKLGPWQHSLRKRVGTGDMIFALRELIEKSLAIETNYNEHLNVAFLDLEKAFDRIPRGNV